MPTGYTASVVDGKVTEFPEFAAQCARAFGALVTMRDEPFDAPIPEEFAPSNYNAERLKEAQDRLAWLRTLTPEQAEAEATKSYQKVAKANAEYIAINQLQDERLNAMLKKVKAWQPPTADHVGLKEFMTEQIRISLNGPYEPEPAKDLTGQEWLRHEIEKAHKDVGYHAAEQAKEVERARSRTEWVKSLRTSLTAPIEATTPAAHGTAPEHGSEMKPLDNDLTT